MGKSTYIKLQQKCHFDDVDIFKMLLHNKYIVVPSRFLMTLTLIFKMLKHNKYIVVTLLVLM